MLLLCLCLCVCVCRAAVPAAGGCSLLGIVREVLRGLSRRGGRGSRRRVDVRPLAALVEPLLSPSRAVAVVVAPCPSVFLRPPPAHVQNTSRIVWWCASHPLPLPPPGSSLPLPISFLLLWFVVWYLPLHDSINVLSTQETLTHRKENYEVSEEQHVCGEPNTRAYTDAPHGNVEEGGLVHGGVLPMMHWLEDAVGEKMEFPLSLSL